MGLADDLTRIAAAAAAYADAGEKVAALLPAELDDGARVYVCAFEAPDRRTWLVLDDRGQAVESRTTVRNAASIAALCEVAEETAAGGDLDELRSRLVALRLTEAPLGIEEAEEAVIELQRTISSPPRVASAERLDAVGSATRRLEQALGENGGSPFAEAMKVGMRSVEVLVGDVERNYKCPVT